MPEHDDLQAVQELNDAYRLITERLGQVIVGQQQVIEELLVAMFARGHCLLVGVPGLAKTLLIRTLADALSLEFRRIQFTPDLMPSDITGTEVIQEDRSSGSREFRFLHRPDLRQRHPGRRNQPHAAQDPGRAAGGDAGISDHGRRAAASARPAVLRAGHAESHRARGHLPAARGPTRPLHVQHLRRLSGGGRGVRHRAADHGRPDGHGDAGPFGRANSGVAEDRPPRAGGRSRGPLCHEVGAVDAAPPCRGRPSATRCRQFIRDYVSWGAGPRASQFLVLGAKARAVLHGRFCAGTDDVRAVAFPVLRHRIVTNFNAEAEGIKPEDLVRRLIDTLGEGGVPAGKLSPVIRKEGGRSL